jgi:hypothetical protein
MIMIELVSAKIGFQLLFYIYAINLESSREDIKKCPSWHTGNFDYSGSRPSYMMLSSP